MCLAIPARIEELDPPHATVSFRGARKRIRTDFLDNLNIGDYVLIHAGFAIQKLDSRDLEELEELWKAIKKGIQ